MEIHQLMQEVKQPEFALFSALVHQAYSKHPSDIFPYKNKYIKQNLKDNYYTDEAIECCKSNIRFASCSALKLFCYAANLNYNYIGKEIKLQNEKWLKEMLKINNKNKKKVKELEKQQGEIKEKVSLEAAKKRKTRGDKTRELLLAKFSETGTINGACRQARVSVSTFWRHFNTYPEFRKQFEQIKQELQ